MKLSQQHIDVLKEIGNIGSGNAAGALAELIKLRISMSVPSASVVSIEDTYSMLPDKNSEFAGIKLSVSGSICGCFLLLISEETCIKLLKMLIPNSKKDSILNLDDFSQSCLMEIGNILAGSFSGALSILIQNSVINSLPVMTFGKADKIISNVVEDMQHKSGEIVMIETSFLEGNEDLRIHILLIPTSLDVLFEKIGVGAVG